MMMMIRWWIAGVETNTDKQGRLRRCMAGKEEGGSAKKTIAHLESREEKKHWLWLLDQKQWKALGSEERTAAREKEGTGRRGCPVHRLRVRIQTKPNMLGQVRSAPKVLISDYQYILRNKAPMMLKSRIRSNPPLLTVDRLVSPDGRLHGSCFPIYFFLCFYVFSVHCPPHLWWVVYSLLLYFASSAFVLCTTLLFSFFNKFMVYPSYSAGMRIFSKRLLPKHCLAPWKDI